MPMIEGEESAPKSAAAADNAGGAAFAIATALAGNAASADNAGRRQREDGSASLSTNPIRANRSVDDGENRPSGPMIRADDSNFAQAAAFADGGMVPAEEEEDEDAFVMHQGEEDEDAFVMHQGEEHGEGALDQHQDSDVEDENEEEDEDDDDGRTPLHSLIESGSCTPEGILALLRSFPPPPAASAMSPAASPASSWLLTRTSSGGYTPLHLACRSVLSEDVILTLARAGGPVSIAAADEEGDTALHSALRYGASDAAIQGLVEVCLSAPPPFLSPPRAAVVHGAAPAPPVAGFVSALHVPDTDGDLPLHAALRHSASPSSVRALLYAAPPTVTALNREGQTPLNVACEESGDAGVGLEVLEVLVQGAVRLFTLPPVCSVPLPGQEGRHVAAAVAAQARAHAEHSLRGWCVYPDAKGQTPIALLWEKYITATFGPDDECREEVQVQDDVEDASASDDGSVASQASVDPQDQDQDQDQPDEAKAADSSSEPHELWESLVLILCCAHRGCVLERDERNRPYELVDAALGLALRGLCPPDLLELVARYHPAELARADDRGRLMLHRALEAAAGTKAACRRFHQQQHLSSRSPSPPSPTTVVDAPHGTDATEEDDNRKMSSHETVPANAAKGSRRGADGGAAIDRPPPVLSPAGAAVRIILSAHPPAASRADGYGRLPLHIAAGAEATPPSSSSAAGRALHPHPVLQPTPRPSLQPLAWAEDGVEEVFLACPDANCSGDGAARLAPFMLAAASASASSSKNASSSAAVHSGASAFANPSPADAAGNGRAAAAAEEDDDVAAVEAAFQLLLRSPWLVKGGIPPEDMDKDKGAAGLKFKASASIETKVDGPARRSKRRFPHPKMGSVATTASSSPAEKKRCVEA